MPSTTAQRGWVPLAVVLVIGLALAAVVGVAYPLALIFLAIVVGEAMRPVVALLERRLSRAIAVVVAYLALMLIGVGVGWVVVPSLVAQARNLVRRAPDLIAQAREWLDHWDPGGGEQLVGAVQDQIVGFSGWLVVLPLTLVSSLVEIFLVVFMSAYWLMTAPALGRFVHSLVPAPRQKAIDGVLRDIGETMGGYVRATIIDAFVIAVLVYAGLRVIGVEFAMVLAMIAAVGELIPIAGPILAAVPALGVSLLGSPEQAGLVLVFYVVLQQFESHVLMPLVMRKQANIPPLLTIVAVLIGASVGGVLGTLVAIPLAGALRVVVVRVAAQAVRRWTGARSPDVGEGAGVESVGS